jgi:hypothetical protein
MNSYLSLLAGPKRFPLAAWKLDLSSAGIFLLDRISYAKYGLTT